MVHPYRYWIYVSIMRLSTAAIIDYLAQPVLSRVRMTVVVEVDKVCYLLDKNILSPLTAP